MLTDLLRRTSAYQMIDKALALARMGCLHCRLAFELPTQTKAVGKQTTQVQLMNGAAQGTVLCEHTWFKDVYSVD